MNDKKAVKIHDIKEDEFVDFMKDRKNYKSFKKENGPDN
jgi:hypothetical protein